MQVFVEVSKLHGGVLTGGTVEARVVGVREHVELQLFSVGGDGTDRTGAAGGDLTLDGLEVRERKVRLQVTAPAERLITLGALEVTPREALSTVFVRLVGEKTGESHSTLATAVVTTFCESTNT